MVCKFGMALGMVCSVVVSNRIKCKVDIGPHLQGPWLYWTVESR